jgi:hypothetical protein
MDKTITRSKLPYIGATDRYSLAHTRHILASYNLIIVTTTDGTQQKDYNTGG